MDDDYKVFFDDAPIALIRTDIETGKFLMANKYAAVLLGCRSAENLKDNYVASHFYPDEEQRRQLIRDLKLKGRIEDREAELKLPDGRNIWIKVNLQINCGGTCIEGFLRDITEIVNLRKAQLCCLENVAKNLDEKIQTLTQ